MGVCDVPVISTVCDTAGEAAATLVSAPFDWLAQAIGQAAAWMFEGVWQIFDTTTLVDVTSGGYVGVYNIVFGIGIVLTLLFFTLQLLTGLIHRDPTALQRAALGLAKSVLGSFLVITVTAAALEIVDQLCIGIVQATGTTMEEMGGRIAALAAGLVAINIAAPGVGAIITIFLAGLAISAAAIVWFSLLIRKALLLVAIVMAPIALAGHGWDATRGWFSKWAAFVLALIVSKLVLLLIFLVAVTQVAAPIDFDLASIAEPVAGIVLMLIAGFAPYMCYKLISFIGVDMYHAMSTEQEAKNAVNRPLPIPSAPKPRQTEKVLDHQSPDTGSGDGGGDTPGPRGRGPTPPEGGPAPSWPGATGGGGAASGSSGGTAGGAAGAAGAAAAAGRKLGKKVGAAAEEHADASTSATPPRTAPSSTPPSAASGGGPGTHTHTAPAEAGQADGSPPESPRPSSRRFSSPPASPAPSAPPPPARSSPPAHSPPLPRDKQPPPGQGRPTTPRDD